MHPSRKQQDLVFDVGLHRGEDTAFYLAKGFRVVAVEADPELAAFGRERFREAIASGRLVIAEGAVVEPTALRAGQTSVTFFKNVACSVWGTTLDTWKQRNERMNAPSERIEVPVLDFAALLRTHGIPRYLKIDIEGCDTVCLRALEQFDEKPDYVSFESDKTSYGKIRDEIALLQRLGYVKFQAVEQSKIPGRRPPPQHATEGMRVHDFTFEDGSSGLFGSELPGPWKTGAEVLREYALIRLAYYLVGDDGVLNGGAPRVRSAVMRALRLLIGNEVPGWYDTHAMHSTAATPTS